VLQTYYVEVSDKPLTVYEGESALRSILRDNITGGSVCAEIEARPFWAEDHSFASQGKPYKPDLNSFSFEARPFKKGKCY